MPSRDQKLTGSTGEHFVCSTLAQLDWAASLTREGVARADILAVRADMGAEQPERPMIEVQVKTMRHHRKPMWPMGARGITPAASAREWYVFVLLGKDVRDRPRCWVVPRVHAVAGAWIAHMHCSPNPAFRPDSATHRSRRHASASTYGIATKNGGTCWTRAPMTRGAAPGLDHGQDRRAEDCVP